MEPHKPGEGSMTTSLANVAPDDRYVAAEIDRGQSQEGQFDAGMYSFFGVPHNSDDAALGGALEDGLEAPPEEDGLPAHEFDGLSGLGSDYGGLGLGNDEDLSLASMLRHRFVLRGLAPEQPALRQNAAAATDDATKQDELDNAMASATSQRSVDDVFDDEVPSEAVGHHTPGRVSSQLSYASPVGMLPAMVQQLQSASNKMLASMMPSSSHVYDKQGTMLANSPYLLEQQPQQQQGWPSPYPAWSVLQTQSAAAPNFMQQLLHKPSDASLSQIRVSGPMTLQQLEAQMHARLSNVTPPAASSYFAMPQQLHTQLQQQQQHPGLLHDVSSSGRVPAQQKQHALADGHIPPQHHVEGLCAIPSITPSSGAERFGSPGPSLYHTQHSTLQSHMQHMLPPPLQQQQQPMPPYQNLSPRRYMQPHGSPQHQQHQQHQHHAQGRPPLQAQQQQHWRSNVLMTPWLPPYGGGLHPSAPLQRYPLQQGCGMPGGSLGGGPSAQRPVTPAPRGPLVPLPAPPLSQRPLPHPAAMGYRQPGGRDSAGQERGGFSHTPWPAQWPGAKLMSGDEIDAIMKIMYTAVTSGVPYVEDYYYQAFVHHHCGGRSSVSFVPEALRDLSEDMAKLDPRANVKFVNVAGLGKLVYSNIRTPRVLMDLSTKDSKPEADGCIPSSAPSCDPVHASVAPLRPLEQEPLLAARIMVEDCMGLLLDVDDIDRLLAASGGSVEDAAALQQRRALLIAGITSSFRLPDTPASPLVATADSNHPTGAAQLDDGVFLRIMALYKGRSLLARMLRCVVPSPGAPQPRHIEALGLVGHPPALGSPHRFLWAALRNAVHLFGASLQQVGSDTGPTKALAAATARIAAGMCELVRRMTSARDVMCALEAFLAGLAADASGQAVLPLTPRPGTGVLAGEPWLGDALAALLIRAEQLGLGRDQQQHDEAVSCSEPSPAPGTAWSSSVTALLAALTRHLEALAPARAAMMASGGDTTEAALALRALSCRPLVQAIMPHASHEQRLMLTEASFRLA